MSPAAPGTLVRHTHPAGFRSGEWATVRAVVPGDGRECYLVEFPDGVTDFWAVSDPDEPYQFLVDLSDDRRGNKPWLPPDDRDVTNGLVVADSWGKPACVTHGAMNRVDPVRRLYRCQEMYCGVGAEVI